LKLRRWDWLRKNWSNDPIVFFLNIEINWIEKNFFIPKQNTGDSAMADKHTDKINYRKMIAIVVGACTAVLLITCAVFAVKFLLKDDAHRRKRQIQMVTVVKPPPPPKVKEKPPEPEVKKEELVEPEPEEAPPEPVEDQAQDEPPPGEDLGVDAEGTAGSDGFGLKANKGGRALIGGSYSDASMMRRYAWYTRIIQEELRKRMKRYMEDNGGIPDGNLKALVSIELNEFGKIVNYRLAGSSGDSKLDDAVLNALKIATISEPPPNGMPRVIKLKVSAKG
jgi:protein TonB